MKITGLGILNNIIKKVDTDFEKELRIYLEMKAANEPDHTKLINDGLHVIANPVTQLITVED